MMPPDPIPTGIAECCREWVIALGYKWGSCGICGERPRFKHALPESEWIHPRQPVDERTRK